MKVTTISLFFGSGSDILQNNLSILVMSILVTVKPWSPLALLLSRWSASVSVF